MRKGSYDTLKNSMNKSNDNEGKVNNVVFLLIDSLTYYLERNIRDIVPELFFRDDFDITNSSTFYKVYEDDNDSHTYKTLENLQNYLSIIEKELSDKLNKRTDSFFHAFEDLQNLHSTLKQSFSRTEEFKELLSDADVNMVKENLNVIKKQIRLRNLKDVQNKLSLIVNIKKTFPLIKDLISKDQVFEAIEYIEQAEEIISTQLIGINITSGFKAQLSELNDEIDHKLISQFVILACDNLELHGESKQKIVPLIKQLVNINFSKLSKALDYYLEIQEKDISDLIVKCWKGEMNNIDTNNTSRIMQFINGDHKGKGRDELDENTIINLDSSIFIERFEYLVLNLFKKIRSAKNLYNIIEDVFSSMNKNQDETSSSQTDETEESQKMKLNEQKQLRMKLLLDLNDLLNSLTDIVNVRISKIFKLREDQHKRLTPQKFISLYMILLQFIKDCETLTQRENYLRSTLSSFRKAFLDSTHTNKIAKLSLILENENWLRAEIASEFSCILKCLVDPSLPLQFTIDENAENMKDIYFDGERYLLVNSSLLFTKMVYDYILILEEIPEIHADIISKISDLFNTFHTKTYSLILGRRAVKISTLKSISATHMALTWQSLTLMISIIPKIRERIIKLDDNSNINFTELDNVLREFILHREEVISKIVTLMSDRLDSLFKNYKVEELSTEPSKPFVQLAEKTKVLHKILKATIHQQHFNIIFKQIILLYNNKLTNIFSNVTIKSPKEKQKMLQDVYYFLGKLRELEGIEDPTDEVAEYVHAHVK